MNLRALAAADPDTPERQRNCGVVPRRRSGRDPDQGRQRLLLRPGDLRQRLAVPRLLRQNPPPPRRRTPRRPRPPGRPAATRPASSRSPSRTTWTTRSHRLVDAERAAWKRVTAGAAWQRLKRRLGIAGHIIALEFTWGDENGWHPHYHVLLVHDQDLDAAAIAALHAHIHSRLAASCRDHGLRQPDQLHAVRIDPNVSATAAGAYVAKGGDWTPAEEMTRGDLKTSRTGSRTPFQILADYYQTGDTRDRDLWHEYAVTRSLAAVRWSRGLRATVLGTAMAPERSDKELATHDVCGCLLAVINLHVWARIRNSGLEHAYS